MAHENDKVPLITAPKANTDSVQPLSPFSDGNAGIDTCVFSIPVDMNTVDSESSLWTCEDSSEYRDSGKVRHKLTGHLQMEYADIRIVLFPQYEHIRLTFNAARLITPKSAVLLHPDALKPLVAAILGEIRPAVTAAFDIDSSTGEVRRDPNWASYVKTLRLDIARNLSVDQPEEMKAALQATKPKYGKQMRMYWDANGGWTLDAGTQRNGHDRIYDKAAERENFDIDATIDAEDGLFRYETQLEGDRLEKFGLKTLDSINTDRVWEALKARWDALGWGVTIPEPNTVLTAVSHLPQAEQDSLLGFLFKCAQGKVDGYTPARLRLMHQKARECGLIPGVPIDLQGVARRVLSLEQGKFIYL